MAFADGAEPYVIGHAQDVTDLKEVQDELKSLSISDELTSLYNRRGFFTLAEQHFKLKRRTKDRVLLLFADIDGTREHRAGARGTVREVPALVLAWSREQPGRAGLGTQAGEARLREVMLEGGFGSVRRAAETPLNLVLEARA